MVALLVIAGCDALFALLAVPLMLRMVPPNVVYGYRTRATLRSEPLWYDANAHFGVRFLIGSLISLGAALVLYALRPAAQFVPLAAVVLVVPPLIAAIATARYIRNRA